jgi:hypothetical protein
MRSKRSNVRKTQLFITLGALIVAFAHLIFPQLVIDGITVTLLAIAVLPWLHPLFKAIELPGGLKVEYQELLKAEKEAEDAGLLAPSSTKEGEARHIYAFEAVVGNDPNLALAGLRIEIESRLREIAIAKNIPASNKPLSRLLRELRTQGFLSPKEISVIDDLLPLLNRAAHGAEVDERGSRWALDIGIRILRALKERQGEMTMPQLLDRWRARSGAATIEVGMELSKTFAKSPLAFLRAMKSDPESFTTWLNELGNHTFTMFMSRGELEDDLHGAYYEKLKSLMYKAAEQSLESDCREQAQQILEVLKKTEIKRIW